MSEYKVHASNETVRYWSYKKQERNQKSGLG